MWCIFFSFVYFCRFRYDCYLQIHIIFSTLFFFSKPPRQMTTYHSTQDKQSSNTEESSQDAAPCPVSPSEVPADDREATQLELQPLLDPDDPRVSPLKLERIRLLKVIATTLVYVNLVLFVVLLVSQFFAIPGFNNRGKSFWDLTWP